MEDVLYLEQEEDNRKKGLIVSIVAHLLLLLICLFPYMTVQEPTQEISGILVALGTPDGGNSADISATMTDADTDAVDKASTPTSSTSAVDKAPKPTPVEQAPPEVKEKPAPTKPVEMLTDESDDPIVQETTEQQKQEAAEALAAKEAAERQKAAEEQAAEVARKAAEEKAAKEAAYQASKKQYSDLFGSGRGTNGNTGNEGDPNGDPDADNLKGLAKGSGRIGGGLSDRGLVYEPQIADNTQKTGKVVIKVCVDETGAVSEARFTQRGSTTVDKHLIAVAEKAALKYKFTPAEVDTQCGTITVDFKVGM